LAVCGAKRGIAGEFLGSVEPVADVDRALEHSRVITAQPPRRAPVADGRLHAVSAENLADFFSNPSASCRACSAAVLAR
jgi:hypothetical protein